VSSKVCQKNTPLLSRPNWAKLTFVVAEETNRKPCPVLFFVLAVTLMAAEVSKKSPEKRLTGSLNPMILRVTPLHLRSSDSMTAPTMFPRGCVGVRLFETAKASNTQMFLT